MACWNEERRLMAIARSFNVLDLQFDVLGGELQHYDRRRKHDCLVSTNCACLIRLGLGKSTGWDVLTRRAGGWRRHRQGSILRMPGWFVAAACGHREPTRSTSDRTTGAASAAEVSAASATQERRRFCQEGIEWGAIIGHRPRFTAISSEKRYGSMNMIALLAL